MQSPVEIATLPPSRPELSERSAMLAALSAFIRQRPGLDFGNYGDVSAYRAECRQIARDKREAMELLYAVTNDPKITADALLKASEGAFSGRLTIKRHWDVHPDSGKPDTLRKVVVDYCTGQYFPTEYRKAACAVLASALWDSERDAMPAPTGYRAKGDRRWSDDGREYLRAPMGPVRASEDEARAGLAAMPADPGGHHGYLCTLYGSKREEAGDYLRRVFRDRFGAALARRWFN